MDNYIEPIHDTSARDTGTSKDEGRLKEGISKKFKKRKKLKSILNKYKK